MLFFQFSKKTCDILLHAPQSLTGISGEVGRDLARALSALQSLPDISCSRIKSRDLSSGSVEDGRAIRAQYGAK